MVKIKKGARKKFFELSIPLTSVKVNLYGYSEEEFNGKTVKIDMSKHLRGKGLELRAKVNAKEGEMSSELSALEIFPSNIRRMMRRGTDYIEDSFEVLSKDAKLRIKPFMITRKRVSRTIRKLIRENTKKNLEAYAKARDVVEIFSEVMTNKLQKDLSFKAKKIYPLALCEIRVVEIVERFAVPNSQEIKAEKKSSNKVRSEVKDSEISE